MREENWVFNGLGAKRVEEELLTLLLLLLLILLALLALIKLILLLLLLLLMVALEFPAAADEKFFNPFT